MKSLIETFTDKQVEGLLEIFDVDSTRDLIGVATELCDMLEEVAETRGIAWESCHAVAGEDEEC
jgi:hypothetical protein